MERKDKIRNQAKIIKEIASDPLITDRELEKKTGLSRMTAHRVKKEMGPTVTKIEAIQEIISNDLEMVKLGQNILKQRMETQPEKMSNKDIISATDTGAKRYSMFKGDITNNDGGLKEGIIITWN